MVSPQHDKTIDFVNLYWLWLPKLELHKINTVNIQALYQRTLQFLPHNVKPSTIYGFQERKSQFSSFRM